VKDDRLYLEHVLECIRRIEEDIAGGRDAFMASHTHQDAVLRNLQTMAESMQRVSDSVKTAHPDVAWRQIGAFRNILVHDYLGTDLELIWEITQVDVPALKTEVEAILAGLPATD